MKLRGTVNLEGYIRYGMSDESATYRTANFAGHILLMYTFVGPHPPKDEENSNGFVANHVNGVRYVYNI